MELRKKAESILSERAEKSSDLADMDLLRLIQELQTHQIELELQSDELRLAQKELEASRSEYQELYDSATVALVSAHPEMGFF
jgi:two-component system, cell cycle sensor histidine kinase and response regulator CckA